MKTILRLLLVAGLFVSGFVRLATAQHTHTPTNTPTNVNPDLLAAYVKVAEALAADDLATAKSAATVLSDRAGINDQFQITKQATVVAKAVDISAAREAFKPLSLSIEPLAVGEKGYTIMTCSMANADWVQASGDVKNPYLGQAMPTCGEPKKIAAAPEHGCGDAAPGAGHAGHAQQGCG